MALRSYFHSVCEECSALGEGLIENFGRVFVWPVSAIGLMESV